MSSRTLYKEIQHRVSIKPESFSSPIDFRAHILVLPRSILCYARESQDKQYKLQTLLCYLSEYCPEFRVWT